MSDEAKLVAQLRAKTGTAESRRLRRRGVVPGNVYGHGQDPVLISVSADSLDALIHAGNKVIDIDIEGKPEKAMFREVQWDTFGITIQHVDLIRIDADESVVVEVPIEFRGVAPGTLAGGVQDQHLRTVTIECNAGEILDSLVVRIGELEIGDAIHIRDLDIPAKMTIQNPPDTVVVQINQPTEEPEEPDEGLEAGPAEPEVIGKKEEEPEAK